MRKLLPLVIALALAGCASVELSSPGSLDGIDFADCPTKPDRLLVVHNSGMEFLCLLPVYSGDLSRLVWRDDGKIDCGTKFFSKVDGLPEVYRALHRTAVQERRYLAETALIEGSHVDMSAIPGTNIPIPIVPIHFREMNASTVLRQKGDAQ